MELRKIVLTLIGPVEPVGEKNEDEKRFENLKLLCKLTEELVSAIDKVSYDNKDPKMGKYAYNFLTNNLGII